MFLVNFFGVNDDFFNSSAIFNVNIFDRLNIKFFLHSFSERADEPATRERPAHQFFAGWGQGGGVAVVASGWEVISPCEETV